MVNVHLYQDDGPYSVLAYTEHFVEVELPLSEQDAGFPGPALMHVALWLRRCTRWDGNSGHHDDSSLL